MTRQYTDEERARNAARARKYYAENTEARKNACRQYQLDNPEKNILQRARVRAKAKGLPFDLVVEDIIIPDRCPILGIVLEPGQGAMHDASPSLDRIRPDLGYVAGNIAVISQKANRAKSNLTPEELAAVALWADEQTALVTYGRRWKY